MPPHTDHGDETLEAANASLNDGLKSCRAVLSNYRTLLAGESDDEHGSAEFNEIREMSRWGDD